MRVGISPAEHQARLETIAIPLEAGMVLCIHPGLRKPGIGGVFVGGTALLEPGGAVPLHAVPPDLQ